MWFTSKALVHLIILFLCGNAWADASSAAHNLFVNMSLARLSYGKSVTEHTTEARPTLIKGIYVIRMKSNKEFISYTNEAGTISGGSDGLKVFSASGNRPLTSEELRNLRTEVMRNISYANLVKVPYGNGGGRKILLFSAVDCPYCKIFEASMKKYEGAINTTFYVVPSALRAIELGGLKPGLKAIDIWCAVNSTKAWKKYWVNQSSPKKTKCHSEKMVRSMAKLGYYLKDFLAATGTKIHGYPGFVDEAGSILSVNVTKLNSKNVKQLFGEKNKPRDSPHKRSWL